MNQPMEVPHVFEENIPGVASCLEYNLHLLSHDASALLFDTLKFVYDVFRQEVDVKNRKVFLESVFQKIRTVELDPAALLIFIHDESDPDIVRIAVWAYLKHRRGSVGDPFIATQHILSILSKGNAVNCGAILAGLVCFGDRRVCSATRTVRDLITTEDARKFSEAVTGPLRQATAEFCLGWLVDLGSRKNDAIVTHVASALSSIVLSKSEARIKDTQFSFGPLGFTHSQNLQEVEYSDFISDLMPILDLLAERDIPALNEMIAILKDPLLKTINVLERREIPTRRKATDRRIVTIMQQLERRAEQRRSYSRRIATRH